MIISERVGAMKLRIPVVGGRLHLFSTSYSKYLVTHFKARFPWEKVRWTNCVFLIGTFLLSVSVMPAYFWRIGLSVFQVALFIFFFAATGLSITLGYHRLARDSLLMAWFTFGEGYHNFHHEFQHDYRNGVKPWQFDPTKW